MSCHISRRDFMAASAAGGSLAVLNPSSGTGPAGQEQYREHTRVYTLFTTGTDPKWPCPDIDPGAESRAYLAELSKLAELWKARNRKSGFSVEFVGGDVLKSDEDLAACARKLHDVDGVLIFALSIPDGGLTEKTLSLAPPKIFYFPSPSTAGFITVARVVREGQQADLVHSSDLGEIEPHIRTLDTMRRLRQTRVLCLSSRSGKAEGYNPEKMRQNFGITVKSLDFTRLNQLMDSADSRVAERNADEFIAGSVRMVEPTREEIILSEKFYLAVKQLLKEENATVITIDCLPGFYSGQLRAYPCVAWTRLLDEGLTGVCEADLQSTLMSLILQYYTGGKPGFVSDPFFDTSQNTITYAHCVAATRMNGPTGPALPYILRSHMEDNKGVSLQVEMPEGQVLTTAQIINCDTVIYHTARVIGNSDSPRGCRTKPVCRLIDPWSEAELSADKLLHNWQGPWHKVSFFGNYAADLEKMSRLMGFKLIREI
ncbi:MAG TPA: twin-arginine translocation signal domain-containing protein [Acidobacteriota bacterium]|nr:twin-arginine translocation signal domain-containing protein [Acidobacteriota bacterium]